MRTTSGIITAMKTILQSTKLWTRTIRKLKLIAALTNSTMVAVTDRLADEELRRVGYDQGTPDQTKPDA